MHDLPPSAEHCSDFSIMRDDPSSGPKNSASGLILCHSTAVTTLFSALVSSQRGQAAAQETNFRVAEKTGS